MVSAIPVLAIGYIIGFVGAVMGIGGGFLLVPMLIYILRVPTVTVIGTSMVLTLVTMASAPSCMRRTNHLVDAVLALFLMVGGVVGAQFGARAGQRISGERLRLLLGLLVLAVGIRFGPRSHAAAGESVLAAAAGGRLMTWPASLILLVANRLGHRAWRRRPRPSVITSLSEHRVMVTSSFNGSEVVLFAESSATPACCRCAAITTSPLPLSARARTSLRFVRNGCSAFWVNYESRVFENAPSYLAVLTNRPLEAITNSDTLPACSSGSTISRCRSASTPRPPMTCPARLSARRS